MTDQQHFTIPLRLRGLQAYVITKACIFGLMGINRTEVSEWVVLDYLRENEDYFVKQGLTLGAAMGLGYNVEPTQSQRSREKLELNGRSFIVQPSFYGYPAFLIDWHVSNGLYGTTRKGMVCGLLEEWVVDTLVHEGVNTNIIEAERLGYIPVRTR